MFGLFKRDSKTVDDIFDKDNGLLTQVGGWIGRLHYTDEEQALAAERFRNQINAGVVEFVEKTLSENTERSKTRRAVALLWIRVQLLMLVATMVAAPFDAELASFYLEIAFGTVMVAGTLAIIGFFFGSHLISAHFIPKILGGKGKG